MLGSGSDFFAVKSANLARSILLIVLICERYGRRLTVSMSHGNARQRFYPRQMTANGGWSRARTKGTAARATATLLLAAVLGCAAKLAPIDTRAVTAVDDISNVDRGTAYSRALIWFDNNHGRAGIRVTNRDPETATIVGSGEMQCHSSVGAGLRAMGMGFNQNYLRFNVEFQARDGRFKISFTELFYYVTDIRYSGSNLTQGPSSKAEVDTLYRECLRPLEMGLARAVATSSSSDF